MRKLYVAMVGLPARGKSTLARRIRQGLLAEGIRAQIFNNGDMRRALVGAESTEPDFYNPENSAGREIREQICLRNMARARAWLAEQGEVAILDATNASRARRILIEQTPCSLWSASTKTRCCSTPASAAKPPCPNTRPTARLTPWTVS